MTTTWLCVGAGLLRNMRRHCEESRRRLEAELCLARKEASRLRDAAPVLDALTRAFAAAREAGAAECRMAALVDQLLTGLARTSA